MKGRGLYTLGTGASPVEAKDVIDWATWMETADRHVAKDQVGDVTVSTVFLGIDHSFGGSPPVLWETMIFGGTHDQYQERYTSREDALTGHAHALALAKGEVSE